MNDTPNENPNNEWDKLPVVARPSGGAVAAYRPQERALALSPQDQPAAGEEDEFDLRNYWHVILKRRWTVISVLAAAVAIAVVQTMLTTPLYRATATLQFEAKPIRVLPTESVVPADNPADFAFVQTQLELLRSRSLAERVAANLDLLNDPDYLDAGRPTPIMAFLRSVFGSGEASGDMAPAADGGVEGDRPAEGEGVRQVDADSSEADAEAVRRRQEAIVAWLRSGLEVSSVRNSHLVRISFVSADPQLSAKVANGYSSEFIDSNIDRRMDASSFAKQYLETSLADAKARLEASERALIDFAQKQELVEVDNQQTSMAVQAMSDLTAAITRARDERIRAEARWRSVQSSPAGAIPEVLASTLISSLQQQRSSLSAEYQQKLATFKPDFPEMRQLRGRIEEMERQIADATEMIKRSIEAEYKSAVDKEQLLLSQLDSTRNEVLDVRGRSVDYNILKREVETNRGQYEALLQRFKDVGLAGGVEQNNISIVDRARPPGGPFAPSLTRNLQFALILGLLIGVVLAFLVEYLDDTVKNPEDVERKLKLAVLGVIPKLKSGESAALAMADTRSAFSEAYRSLRTALQFSTDRGVPRTLLVTSSTIAEGKSTTAFALAANYAQLGKKVLLLDCDLRNPSLHKRVPGAVNANGLSNYLSGAIKPQEMVAPTQVENLWFAPTGPLPPNPAELLASPRMSALLTVASHKYDLVILDGPPVMGLADVPILSHMSAGTLVVVEAGETRVGVISGAIKRLAAARARVVGVVLTKYDARHAGYGYGYGYGYSYYAYGASTDQKRLARA